MRYVCAFLVSGIVLSLSPAYAEMTNFHAELECDNCTSYSTLTVELRDSGKNHSSTASVGVGGAVDFQGIPEGTYILTVKDFRGDAVHQETVTVRPNGGPISIRLPEDKAERPVSELVSVRRLKHKIPKEAKKAFVKSVQLSEKGDDDACLDYLKRATELDPEYMEAFNNLGARYMKAGKHQQALTAFQRAMELDPSATLVQINASAALMALGDFRSAETTLRRVVQTSGNPKARYMLGLTLYSQREFTDEALDLLRRSEEEFPNARLVMAVIHAKLGHTKEARQVLNTYLATGPEAGRNQAQAMLAGLQQPGK